MAEFALDGICARIIEIVAESLDLGDGASLQLSSHLINDLGAESLDFIDIVFQIEKAFGVKIERGRLEGMLRKRFPELNVKPNTPLNDEIRAVLADLMPEIPGEELRGLQKVKDVARTFRVATFVRLCVETLGEGGATIRAGRGVEGYTPVQLGVAAAAA